MAGSIIAASRKLYRPATRRLLWRPPCGNAVENLESGIQPLRSVRDGLSASCEHETLGGGRLAVTVRETCRLAVLQHQNARHGGIVLISAKSAKTTGRWYREREGRNGLNELARRYWRGAVPASAIAKALARREQQPLLHSASSPVSSRRL